LLIVTLVVILVAACLFLLLQRYVTYTDDGSVRFEPPFFRRDSGEDPSEDTGPQEPPENQDADVNMYVGEGEDGEKIDLGNPSQPAEPAGQPAAAPDQRQLLELLEIPQDPSVLAQALGQVGANGFVVTVKDGAGQVFYGSSAAQADAMAEGCVSADALSEMCAEGRIAVARLNCFHDSFFAFVNMKNAGICQRSGYIWYDNNEKHWLDPSKEDARNYVIGLAVECVQLGFDELLLDEMCYPTTGNLYKIDYAGNTVSKTEALVQFLTELRTAVSAYGEIKLGLRLDEALLAAGSNEDSGEDLAQLLPLVDAVYTKVGDPAAAQARINELCPENPPVLVPVVPEAVAGTFCIGQ